MLGYSYLRLGFRKLVINWQKSERKWNSLRMPVDRKRLPNGLMQRFLIYVEPHQSYKAKWPSRQFCRKFTSSRHLCFGDVTWPRFWDDFRMLGCPGVHDFRPLHASYAHASDSSGSVVLKIALQRQYGHDSVLFSLSRLTYKLRAKGRTFSKFVSTSQLKYVLRLEENGQNSRSLMGQTKLTP